MNIMCARGGMRIWPAPHGHTPAMARNSVDLPVPLSPTISTFSPAWILAFASCTTTLPSASPIWRSWNASTSRPSSVGPSTTSITLSASISSAASKVSSSSTTRSMWLRQSARRGKLSTNQFSAFVTSKKALLICISTPSVIAPAK
jgi:hypothetical protein